MFYRTSVLPNWCSIYKKKTVTLLYHMETFPVNTVHRQFILSPFSASYPKEPIKFQTFAEIILSYFLNKPQVRGRIKIRLDFYWESYHVLNSCPSDISVLPFTDCLLTFGENSIHILKCVETVMGNILARVSPQSWHTLVSARDKPTRPRLRGP